MIVLAVNIQKQAPDFFQRRIIGRAIIDENTRARLGRFLAQNQNIFVRFKKRGEDFVLTQIFVCDFEHGLDRAGFPRRRRDFHPFPKHKAEGINQNGFAGPGFAGESVEFGRKFERGVADQGKVFNVQASEHDRPHFTTDYPRGHP